MVMGSCSDPSMSSTRPIMVAGPMERNSKPLNKGSVETFGAGPVGCPAPRPCPHARLAVSMPTAAIINVVHQRRRKTGARILVTLPKSNFGCPVSSTLYHTAPPTLWGPSVPPATPHPAWYPVQIRGLLGMRPHVEFPTIPGLFVTPRPGLHVYSLIAHIPDRCLNV